MRIIICCNHSRPHVGGTEKIVELIASSLAEKYKHHVVVLSRSIRKAFKHQNVNYFPCTHDSKLFPKQLKELKPDYTFVYSDSFWHWPTLIRHSESIPGRKGIALVGMNHMLHNSQVLCEFKDKKDQFDVVVHSNDYRDYKECIMLGIDVNVIHNGIDFDEMAKKSIDFKKYYNINVDKMILCVSNFFPGKAQDELCKVLDILYQKCQNFIIVFVSTTVNFMPAQVLSNKVRDKLKMSPYKSKFLENIPRDHTISAFHDANVFAFPSQHEVSPVVILECMATKLPWVALPVGNIKQLTGGLFVPYDRKDSVLGLIYSKNSYHVFADHLDNIMTNNDLASRLGNEGYELARQKYDWKDIGEQYNSLFKKYV